MNTKYKNIKHNADRDTKIADKWLKANGIDPQSFAKTRTLILQAQKAAKTLLTEHGEELTRKQVDLLHEFQRAAANIKQIDKVTDAHCHKVLNLQNKFNRQLFIKFKRSRDAH
jgi:predicted  nucleic acid-binding Zn-ribbon protein